MRHFVIGSLLLVLAACSPLQTTTPANTPPVAPTVGVPQPTLASSAPPAPAATAAAATVPPASAVSLQVLSPQDGAIVNTQQVSVTGAASPGAVVSVNDDILLVGPDGQFHDTVTLDEGPNVIEIVASNTSGSETSLELAVTYEP